MSSVQQLLAAHREAILATARRHGAHNVRIFGSVARGDDRPDSDIDFLVEFEPDRSLFDQAGLWLDLCDLLGRQVDVLTDGALHPQLAPRVLSEARAI